MDKKLEQPKRKRKFNYISAIFSIGMVLFMLGLFGIILIQSNSISNYIKENLVINIFLEDNIADKDINNIKDKITELNAAKSMFFISKEQAAQEFSKEVGQDFVSFLGYNPLMPSLQINLNADFANNAKVQQLELALNKMPGVSQVTYQKNVFDQISKNLQTIGAVLIGLALLFTIIAIALINSTVRLHLYAQRFIIKSMQLVGATHWFIIKPFVFKSILNGFFGSVFAILLLLLTLNTAPNYIEGLDKLYDYDSFFILFGFIFLLGEFISICSSFISTNNYLNSRIEDLY